MRTTEDSMPEPSSSRPRPWPPRPPPGPPRPRPPPGPPRPPPPPLRALPPPRGPPPPPPCPPEPEFDSILELQPAFAGSVGHRFHAAVILISTAVEHDLRDPLVLGDRGDLLPDLERLFRLL